MVKTAAAGGRHPVADLFVNTWNIGHEYGPAKWTTPSSIYAMADRRLLSDRIGETSGPSPNLCDATPIHVFPSPRTLTSDCASMHG